MQLNYTSDGASVAKPKKIIVCVRRKERITEKLHIVKTKRRMRTTKKSFGGGTTRAVNEERSNLEGGKLTRAIL